MNRIISFFLALTSVLAAGAASITEADVPKTIAVAEKGYQSAMTDLLYYYYEKGDYTQARQWAEQALTATNGIEHYAGYAARMLGIMYRDGNGSAPDPAKALEYFRKGADINDKYSASSAAAILSDRSCPEVYDIQKSWEMLRRAAELGEYRSALTVARHYDGELTEYSGISPDKSEAVKYYEFYLENMPHTDAEKINSPRWTDPMREFLIGKLRYTGAEGVQRDYEKAFGHLTTAVNAMDNPERIINSDRLTDEQLGEAMWYISVCYRFGRGVTKNDLRARKWLGKAAAKGNKNAIDALKK